MKRHQLVLAALAALVLAQTVSWWARSERGSSSAATEPAFVPAADVDPGAPSALRSPATDERVPLAPLPEEPRTASDASDDVPLAATWDEHWLGEERTAVARGLRVDGRKEGTWRTYVDGEVWTEQEYRAGVLHGKVRAFLAGGTCWSETTYEDGEVRSVSNWHPTGEPALEAEWRGGAPHGATREWYPTGVPKAELVYRDGRLHGRCVYYRPDGSVDPATSGIYAEGERVADLD